MTGASQLRSLLLPLMDSATLVAAFLGALYLRFGQDVEAVLSYEMVELKTVVSTTVFVVCLYYSDLYEDWSAQRPLETSIRVAQALIAGVVTLLIAYYAVPALKVGRGALAIYVVLGFFGLLAIRGVYRWLGEDETLAEQVLILGTGSTAQGVARQIGSRRPWGLHVVGFLADDPAEVGRRIVNPTVLGTIDELPLLVRRYRAGVVVVALDDRRGKLPILELLRCRIEGVRIEEAASVLERLTGRIPLKNLRPSWLVFSHGFNEVRALRNLKYGAEFLAALILLVVFAPVLVLVALAVRLTSPGPVIYRQERIGAGGRPFDVLKFRTMRVDAEEATGPIWASGDSDPRITLLGRLLRKTRLDELPQLLNILKGEMSFVGPRPERPHFVNALRQVIPFYDERHSVRPGITGWAQIRGGYGSSIEDAERKLEYDLYYIKQMSLALDLSIIVDTLKVVIVGRGAR